MIFLNGKFLNNMYDEIMKLETGLNLTKAVQSGTSPHSEDKYRIKLFPVTLTFDHEI